jgi:hypothetical protein
LRDQYGQPGDIPKTMLESRIVALSPMKIEALDAALQFSLGLTTL